MTRYRVIFSKRAYKFLKDINQENQRRLLTEVSDLESFPFLTLHHDLAKIKGTTDQYRLRQGNIRILVRIDKTQRTIFIEKIGYRESFYE